MSDWYPDAKASIDLCTKWARDSVHQKKPLEACRFFLFGSAIYLEGEQFDALLSDLDIVCLMPDGLSAVERVDLLSALKVSKAKLELEMIPTLHRQVCDAPGVSIVALTPFEAAANIHKSGARSFFDRNFFYDLIKCEINLGLNGAGERSIPDARRQVLEFCQKLRNEYLAVSANNTGGLSEYQGVDPIPKALMRCAAQIAPNLPEGAWYDTRHGLEYLFQMLNQCRDEDQKLGLLYKTISIRRGGKGHKEALSAEQQLLLSELLFDLACNGDTEEVVLWEVRVGSSGVSSNEISFIIDAIRRIVPDVRLRATRKGSIILTLQSSQQTFELFQLLFNANLLKAAIGLDILDVQRIENDAQELQIPSDGRLGKIIRFLKCWQFPGAMVRSRIGLHLEDSLSTALANHLGTDSVLSGGDISRSSQLRRMDNPIPLDFVLSWPSEVGRVEQIGIEVSLASSRDKILHDLARVMSVPFPTILLLFSSDSVSNAAMDAIQQMRKVNANVHIVLRNIE